MRLMSYLHTEISRDKSTIFVALPIEACEQIPGGCSCDYCKANPDKMPMWDTLNVDAKGKRPTSMCHYPELPRRS